MAPDEGGRTRAYCLPELAGILASVWLFARHTNLHGVYHRELHAYPWCAQLSVSRPPAKDLYTRFTFRDHATRHGRSMPSVGSLSRMAILSPITHAPFIKRLRFTSSSTRFTPCARAAVRSNYWRVLPRAA
eukprot:scaffold55250_cov34-Tisochrysis_lutea.AAC.3